MESNGSQFHPSLFKLYSLNAASVTHFLFYLHMAG